MSIHLFEKKYFRGKKLQTWKNIIVKETKEKTLKYELREPVADLEYFERRSLRIL